MSGRAAISGFMCQAMIAIISFLDDESWDTMTMEPKGIDAVDIILKKENAVIKCVQIKAWHTAYRQSDLKKAFTNLCNSLPNASHELILVGENYAVDGEKYISDISTNGTATSNSIKTVRLNPEELEKQLIGCAVNYVKRKKYLYTVRSIEDACEKLQKRILSGTTIGKEFSRNDVNKIIKHCCFLYNPVIEVIGTFCLMLIAFSIYQTLSINNLKVVNKDLKKDHQQQNEQLDSIQSEVRQTNEFLANLQGMSEADATGLTEPDSTTGRLKSGWGPMRNFYSMEHPADKITFNSIVDNIKEVGSELFFVSASPYTGDADKNYWSDHTVVEDGQLYTVRIYVHNNAGYKDYTAQDVKISLVSDSGYGSTFTYSAIISCSNSDPAEVWDGTTFYAPEGMECCMEYVEDAIFYYNNAGQHTFSSEEIKRLFNGEPVSLGWEEMDGNIPACNEYSGYFTIRLRASVRDVHL